MPLSYLHTWHWSRSNKEKLIKPLTSFKLLILSLIRGIISKVISGTDSLIKDSSSSSVF